MSNQNRAIKVMRLANVAKYLNLPTNFSHLLKADLDQFLTISASSSSSSSNSDENKDITFDSKSNTLKYQYKLPYQNFPLSGYLAVMDEVTSWTSMQLDQKNRLGVSVLLEADIGPGFFTNASDEVEFQSTVEKIGYNLGFTSAKVINKETKEVICSGRHTKFLNMGMANDFILTETGLYIAETILPYIVSSKNSSDSEANDDIPKLEEVMEHSVDISENGLNGTAKLEPCEKNGMGGLHGGFQAMLMEKIGQLSLQKKNITTNKFHLDSISVSFMSAVKKKDILYFDVEYLVFHQSEKDTNESSFFSMTVQLRNEPMGKVVSQGILRWKSKTFT